VTAENIHPDSTGLNGKMLQIANATNRGDEQTKSARKCGQIYGGRIPNTGLGASTQRRL
jgi:hypothetical protein